MMVRYINVHLLLHTILCQWCGIVAKRYVVGVGDTTVR